MGLLHYLYYRLALLNAKTERKIVLLKIEEEKDVLWLDDHIHQLGPYISSLEQRGFQVTGAQSTEEAVDLAKARSYDVILADIKMPAPNGIEALRMIRPIQKNAAFAVLSSYLYLDRYRAEIQSLDFDVQLIDKDMPGVESEDFENRFIWPIVELADKGVTTTLANQKERLDKLSGVDPFSVNLNDFMKRSLIEKDLLLSEARRIAKPILDSAFESGKIWVLLCGSPETIRASARSIEEVMEEDQVMEFAISQQRPPYQFFRPMDVEDYWSDCSPTSPSQDYPTVTLMVKEEEILVHFDTGSPVTFFSYEELRKLNAIRPTTIFGQFERGKSVFSATKLNVTVLLKCQGKGTMREVDLRGLAVRDWVNGPFARFCKKDCPKLVNGGGSDRKLCYYRVGLVGRNLITENKISLVLDGASRKTTLIGRPRR